MHTQNHDGITLTVEEAARRLGIGRTLAYELARRGQLPGLIRLGRTYRVSRPALDRVLGMAPNAPEPQGDRDDPEAA